MKVVNIKDYRPSVTGVPAHEADPWENHHILVQAVAQMHPEEDRDLVDYLLNNFILEVSL